MASRAQKIDLKQALSDCGYLHNHLSDIALFNFDSFEECADYLGCSPTTVKRWIDMRRWPVAAARLLLIKHRGFLPTTKEWRGFTIRGDTLITPHGKSIKAQDLSLLHLNFGMKHEPPLVYVKRAQEA